MSARKRFFIVAEFALVLLAVLAIATVASYAWFHSRLDAGTAFTVEVAGSADIEVRFYSAWDATVPVEASTEFTFISEEAFYPGLSVERKVEIVNKGGAAAANMRFTDVTLTVTEITDDPDGAKTDALISYLDAHFLIKVSVDGGAERDVRFVARAYRGEDIPVISDVALSAGATAVAYYRFWLDPLTERQEGNVAIGAGGIRITAD